jgi:hypothetical protein
MSSLKLNVLLVTKDGQPIYRERFHSGVNIIRGDNSSGKSTLSNFIFYALGGEFIDWLPEAALCDFVYAELSINNIVLTVKRPIEQSQRRPMWIFYGELDKAIQYSFEGWQLHPYSKTDKADTFSQVLFKALGFPEVSTDNQESITINQVLRLMYIDQLSSLDSLMRNEDFDSPLIRSAIGNLLLGTYNDELLKLQLQLRQKEREYSEIKSQVKAIEDVFSNSPFEFKKELINKSIDEKKQQLGKVLKSLSEPSVVVDSVKPTDSKNEIKGQQSALSRLKSRYSEILQGIEKNKLEVLDNYDFISVLESKIAAIKESINSREVLGHLPLQFCPVCLEKLDTIEGHSSCKLCKKEIKEDIGKSKLLRMQLELEMQVKESTDILTEKESKIQELESEAKEIERDLNAAQRDLDEYVNKSRSSVDNKFDKLFEVKGQLMADIGFFEKQLQLIESYESYKVQQFALRNAIERLTSTIERMQEIQRRNVSAAYSRIQHYTLELLKGDGAYEEKFKNGQSVTVDFGRNTFYLDGRNRFSASSMVLLKNCVRFAIFFTSLELPHFRYPKFILCDNMEDKGMVEARSKNFQKNVVSLTNSEQFKGVDFQVIFSTSMVAEELNVSQYTIGPFYNNTKKTLAIASK